MTKRFVSILLATLPAAAMAHTGHGDHTFMEGFTHPFFGADHLLAMFLVGAWSVLHARRIWLAPATFIAMLATGVLVGQHGFIVPQVELFVAASVVALGLMMMAKRDFTTFPALSLVGGFALFHGMAHGGELSVGHPVLLGIVFGSALLHGAGMAFAQQVLQKRPHWATRLGQASALIGSGLMLSSLM